jgi:hypothetical protein
MRLWRDDAAPTPAAEPGTDRVEVSTRVLACSAAPPVRLVEVSTRVLACSAAPPVRLVRLKTGRRA